MDLPHCMMVDQSILPPPSLFLLSLLFFCPHTVLVLTLIAIAEGNGDAALELLKARAETGKKESDGKLATELAPDKNVGLSRFRQCLHCIFWENHILTRDQVAE